MINVIYEDNHIIAAVKPAGVLSQPDKTGDQSLFDQVKAFLKEKYHKPGNAFLGLIHRLDRPASGIVLFAKTSKGASRLSEQFRNHTIEKSYQVIVVGKPEQQKGMLINHLIKDEKLKKARQHANGQEARLYYEVIKSNEIHSLLKVKIETGKFHQIRSQLSLAGFPILGDVKYGAGQALPDKSIALCASDISFYPATKKELITLHIDTPKEWAAYLSTDGG